MCECERNEPPSLQADALLATHYGFTDEELDFIVNYGIKYRMGQEAEADGAECAWNWYNDL